MICRKQSKLNDYNIPLKMKHSFLDTLHWNDIDETFVMVETYSFSYNNRFIKSHICMFKYIQIENVDSYQIYHPKHAFTVMTLKM